MKKTHIILDMLLLTILSGVLLSLFSGSYPFLVPDEARYIEIAREMVASGNYITPHLNGSLFLDKPILFYWCESILIHLFGIREWAMRLLPECLAVIGCLVTYWAGVTLYNRRTGVLSALMLMSMGFYFFVAHYLNMDLLVAVCVSCALWFFITRKLLLVYVFSGLAFLAKGLIGVVFPIAIIGLWIVFMNQWQLLKKMHIVLGLLIIVAIVMPWIVLIQKQTSLFLYYFFYVQQFSRYLTKNFHQHQPFFFYILVILAGTLPWTLFLFQSFYFFIRDIIKDLKNSGKELFLLIWVLCILIFFSLPHSKLAGYILPVFPPIAMMIAHYLDVNWNQLATMRSFKSCVVIWSVLALIFSLMFMYVAHHQLWISSSSIAYVYALSSLFFLSAVLSIGIVFCSKDVKTFFITLFLIACMAEVIAIASIWTYPLHSIKSLALDIRRQIKPNDILVSFDRYYYDLPLYLGQNVLVVSDWHLSLDIKDNWRKELGEGILYKRYLKRHSQQPWLIDQQQFNTLWHGTQRVFVVVRADDEEIELRRLVKSPVYTLRQSGQVVLLSNEE